ncbi:MAG: class I adenylate-forming enzyme family protein [Novosphingobium sp.]|nr:class I adenylate-forming enzyme family protein [Novosphingobium sp.]
MAESLTDDHALVRGVPLEDEPGIGALTLPGFLREIADRYSSNEALVEHRPGGAVERWSYTDLQERSEAVAKSLIACGVGKDSRIGILMTNRLEWVSSCFGIGLAGGTMVGLSTFSTPDELEYLLKATGISILLFEREVVGKDFAEILNKLETLIATSEPGTLLSTNFPYLRRLVAVDDDRPIGAIETWQGFIGHGEAISDERVNACANTVKPSDPAMLLFSSGSTGKPKGIMNSHRGINIQSWRWPRIYDIEAEHPVRFWSANGLFWSGNWSIALGGTLAGGGCLVLQRVFDPVDAIRLFEAERVSLPYCWPHQWAQLEEQPGWATADLSSFWYVDTEIMLRHRQGTIPRARLDPRASYGSTETFTISTAFPVNTPRELWEGTNGEVLPGNISKIVDPETGKLLKRGETGEYACKGPTLMMGYLGVPGEEVFDEDGFYHAGDGGFLDERGRFIFQGRINDIIKTGGANVSPVEVDWSLCACPGVKVCKTTGVAHETLGEMVVSLIVREAGSELSQLEVVAWLKERLASYKVPRKVLFVTEQDIDLTDTSKIKPAEARALAAKIMAREAQTG